MDDKNKVVEIHLIKNREEEASNKNVIDLLSHALDKAKNEKFTECIIIMIDKDYLYRMIEVSSPIQILGALEDTKYHILNEYDCEESDC